MKTDEAGNAVPIGNTIRIHYYHSPCGDLVLGSLGEKLCLCDWMAEKHRSFVDRRLKRTFRAEFEEGMSEVIGRTVVRLDEYFAGKRTSFDIPLLFAGTDFQKRVWNKLSEIPFGETVSYGELAGRLGCPKAVRAVAAANGANAISVIVPCHRVIGSDRSLTGYGGGIAAKKFLLDLEQNGVRGSLFDRSDV